jgi:hypothetical protein
MTDYQIFYRDPWGNLITVITEFFQLDMVRKENDWGSLQLDLPPIYPTGFFKRDGKLEVWRTAPGRVMYMEGETPFFIRKIIYKDDEQGRNRIHILAHDAVQIIDRRIIVPDTALAHSKKTGNADNLMKAVIRENFGTLADDVLRNQSTHLSVAVDLSNGLSITDEFQWQKILPLLQKWAQQSTDGGIYLAFDVVYTSPTTLEFRTYTTARGVNRGASSGNSYILGTDGFGLSYASATFDYTQEATFVYAGGNGEYPTQIIKTASDSTRIYTSPFSRIEDYVDATDDDPIVIQSRANQLLQSRLSKFAINGHIEQGPQSIYGVHYGFGDIVSVNYHGFTVDVHLDGVEIIVDETGREEIRMMARNLEESYY